MPPRQLTLPSPLAKKSNEMCRARLDGGTAFGHRVAMIMAGILYKNRGEVREYELTPNLLADYNLSTANFETICKTMKDLVKTSIFLWNPETMEFDSFPMFGRATYNAKTKKATVKLNHDLIQHYLMTKHFAMIPVFEYIRLTSIYTQKLYEYLFSWRKEYQTEIEIDELHDLLNTPEKYRLNFAQFKRKILEPAYVQIHEETALKFEYVPQIRKGYGKGGKITYITFVFDPDFIEKMATPQYRFTTLSATTQKAIHREFVKHIKESTPMGKMPWLKDPEDLTYKAGFSFFLATHTKCQPIKRKPRKRRRKATKTEESL